MPVGTGCGMIWRDMTGRARASGPPRTTHWRGIGCALVVVSSEGMQSRRWFRFSPTVDFDHCMPADQEPEAKDEG